MKETRTIDVYADFGVTLDDGTEFKFPKGRHEGVPLEVLDHPFVKGCYEDGRFAVSGVSRSVDPEENDLGLRARVEVLEGALEDARDAFRDVTAQFTALRAEVGKLREELGKALRGEVADLKAVPKPAEVKPATKKEG